MTLGPSHDSAESETLETPSSLTSWLLSRTVQCWLSMIGAGSWKKNNLPLYLLQSAAAKCYSLTDAATCTTSKLTLISMNQILQSTSKHQTCSCTYPPPLQQKKLRMTVLLQAFHEEPILLHFMRGCSFTKWFWQSPQGGCFHSGGVLDDHKSARKIMPTSCESYRGCHNM